MRIFIQTSLFGSKKDLQQGLLQCQILLKINKNPTFPDRLQQGLKNYRLVLHVNVYVFFSTIYAVFINKNMFINMKMNKEQQTFALCIFVLGFVFQDCSDPTVNHFLLHTGELRSWCTGKLSAEEMWHKELGSAAALASPGQFLQDPLRVQTQTIRC